MYYSIIAAAVIVLSLQVNECNIIYSSLFSNDGDSFYMYSPIYIYTYIYIYIHVYWYNSLLLMLHFVIYVYSMLYTIDYVLYNRTNDGNGTNILPLFFSPSAVADCYIWCRNMYVYVMSGAIYYVPYNGNNMISRVVVCWLLNVLYSWHVYGTQSRVYSIKTNTSTTIYNTFPLLLQFDSLIVFDSGHSSV